MINKQFFLGFQKQDFRRTAGQKIRDKKIYCILGFINGVSDMRGFLQKPWSLYKNTLLATIANYFNFVRNFLKGFFKIPSYYILYLVKIVTQTDRNKINIAGFVFP